MLTLDAAKYKVPARIFLSLQNYTGTGIVLDSCKDLEVFYNGVSQTLPAGFCSPISLEN
jgi:hypothetical protein